MNTITLVGNLTAAPVIRYTSGGKAVTKFTIASDRGRGDNAGTDFVRVEAWNELAEFLNAELGRGDFVRIVGSLRITSYEKDGWKRTAAHVAVHKAELVGQEVAA